MMRVNNHFEKISGEAALTHKDLPKVSVGMPVYNGADSIEAAVSAILAQSCQEFELIVSDNASTDKTVELCEAAANADPRVRIVRQKENRGPVPNFGAVLEAARGPFFMFAAADDRVEPNFIEETLKALTAAPEAVACAPRTMIHFETGQSREARGSAPIGGPAWWRPARFLLRPADNSRFYGLYRTEVLRDAYLSDDRFHALDWAVSAMTLSAGTHVQSRSIILHRRGAEKGKYWRAHQRDAAGLPDRLFPLARMSATLLRRLRPSQLLLAVPVLLALNASKCAEHIVASVCGRRLVRLPEKGT